MEKKNLDVTIFAIVLLYYCIYSHGEDVSESRDTVDINKEKIDNYILGLKFDRNEVLSYHATGSTNPIPKVGKLSKNDFTVITRTRKSVSKNGSDVGVVVSNQQLTFPGALLLANSRLMDNTPDPVPIPRAPMRYMVNLPGFDVGEGNFSIKPEYDYYQAALSNTLETWLEKHSNYDVATVFQSEHAFVSTKEQLQVQMGVEFKNSKVESMIDFESAMKNEKTIMISKFKQIFYTTSIIRPHDPSDLFDSKVKVEKVMSKMNAEAPPVIVDTVSYGRLIYVMIETTSTSDSTKTTLQTKFSKFGTKVSNKNNITKENELENLRMEVYSMGGGSKHTELMKAETFEAIKGFLVDTSRFSRNNVGFPISYSTAFITDNTRAVVHGAGDYTETKVEVFKHGFLQLEHLGVYVAKFFVYWKEINFDADGKLISTSKEWDGNDLSRTINWSAMIQFPGNARDINVTVKGATGLIWESWRTSVERKNIPLIPKRRITVWGTTLNQKSEIVPEQWE